MIYADEITRILQSHPSGHDVTEYHQKSLEITINRHNFGHNTLSPSRNEGGTPPSCYLNNRERLKSVPVLIGSLTGPCVSSLKGRIWRAIIASYLANATGTDTNQDRIKIVVSQDAVNEIPVLPL